MECCACLSCVVVGEAFFPACLRRFYLSFFAPRLQIVPTHLCSFETEYSANRTRFDSVLPELVLSSTPLISMYLFSFEIEHSFNCFFTEYCRSWSFTSSVSTSSQGKLSWLQRELQLRREGQMLKQKRLKARASLVKTSERSELVSIGQKVSTWWNLLGEGS